jgi:hypothetical protein
MDALDPTSKKEIVLAADDEILEYADMLKEIDALKNEIDSDSLTS